MKIQATLVYVNSSLIICPLDESVKEEVFSAETTMELIKKIPALLARVNEGNFEIVNSDSYSFFSEPEKFSADAITKLNESVKRTGTIGELGSLLEFEMFNVKRKDIMSFKEFLKCAAAASQIETTGRGMGKRKFQQGLFREIKVHKHFQDAIPYIPKELKDQEV